MRGIILIAGMPRSGSTWQFNATRLLLEDAGARHWAGWVDDFPEARSPLKLVKAHNPKDFDRGARVVLTTWRPFADCLGSLVRMGWLEPNEERIRRAYHRQREVYHHWAARSDLETQFDLLRSEPAAAITDIQDLLVESIGYPHDTDRPARIATLLDQIESPSEPIADDGTRETRVRSHDVTTLMHPGHVSSAPENSTNPDIERWIEDLI